MIIGYDEQDYLIAESRIPLSTITTLTRFIERSAERTSFIDVPFR